METCDEVCLKDIHFPNVDEVFLHKRDLLISEKEFRNPIFKLANQFAEAEEIVIPVLLLSYSF